MLMIHGDLMSSKLERRASRYWEYKLSNTIPSLRRIIYQAKGPFIIYGGGWHRREMFFVAKILLTQPSEKSKI